MNQEISGDPQYYEVERIIGKSKIGGKVIYLVKWKNYSESQATWQELSTLEYVKPLIKEYNDEEKSRRKSNSRSNKSSECISQQSSTIRTHQKCKKSDRGSPYINSLRSLDEENQEQMHLNGSSKLNNQHLSNIFLNREDKVLDSVPKQCISFKIINRKVPNESMRPQKIAQFELNNTKQIEQENKGIRKIFKPIKVRLQGSKKFICEKADDQRKQPQKFINSNVSSSSLVDSILSKNQQKAKKVQNDYFLNDVSQQKNFNQWGSIEKQKPTNKMAKPAREIQQIIKTSVPLVKPMSSQQGPSSIKRINLLHSLSSSSNREYLVEQEDSSILVLSGKELLKRHPEQLLEYLQSLISQKGI